MRLTGDAASLWSLFRQTVIWSTVMPLRGRTRLVGHVLPLMHAIGVRSLYIVGLISFLIGAILVLQTAYILAQYGQIELVPKGVAISITRELGPLMTAIVITGRIGAAFTAGLGSMKINEEILALETMAIHPVGYLVAPRFIAMTVMMPCLTAFSYFVGMAGGLIIGMTMFELSFTGYVRTSLDSLLIKDVLSGLVKSVIFGTIITMVACFQGMAVDAEQGPEGVGRNTMVSVVTCLVVIVLADFIVTGIMTTYFP